MRTFITAFALVALCSSASWALASNPKQSTEQPASNLHQAAQQAAQQITANQGLEASSGVPSAESKAAEAKPHSVLTGENEADSKATEGQQDSNYRWHRGRWWYWMPQSRNWKIWNGSSWDDYQAGASRSFSYSQNADELNGNAYQNSAQSATDRMFGRPLTRTPDSVSTNNQIIGSFGFRGAGSKINGNY